MSFEWHHPSYYKKQKQKINPPSYKKDTHLNQEIIQEIRSIKNVPGEKVAFLNQVNSEEKLKDFAIWWIENSRWNDTRRSSDY